MGPRLCDVNGLLSQNCLWVAHQPFHWVERQGTLIPGAAVCAQLIDKIHDRRCLVNSFLQPESRFAKLARTFPLYAVVHERTGLLGTREYAIRLLGQPSMIKAAAAA